MSSRLSEDPPPSGQAPPVHISSDEEDLHSISSQFSETDAVSTNYEASERSLAEDKDEEEASLSGSLDSTLGDERPNRFQGSRKEWYSYTNSERRIAQSVDKAAATDLSRHLFNAFALKKINQQSEEKKWAPRPNWTAWPLPPKVVPRLQEATFMINPETQHPPLTSREELEEILIAGITKEARHRVFYKMQTDTYGCGPNAPDPTALESSDTDTEEYSELEDTDTMKEELESSEDEPLLGRLMARRAQSRADAKQAAAEAKEQGYPLAIPSTDTDFDTALLRPSVRDMQANFDKLLMGLHRSRRNIRPATRRRARSENLSTHPSPAEANSRSRRRSPSRSNLPATLRSNSRGTREVDADETDGSGMADRPRRTRVEQRNWQDVLGMASVTQAFHPLVIERTRARLCSILGEDMGRIP